VDEKSLIAVLGKWDPLERESYRKKTSHFFIEDHERQFQRWNDHCVRLLKHEFVRFKVTFFNSICFLFKIVRLIFTVR